MTERTPPPVPSPSDQWIAQRRAQLVREFARQRRWRAMRVAASAAGGLITLATIIVVGVIGVGPAPAFAGWTPTPTAPSAARLRRAESACGRVGALVLAAPTLADTRGPYTMLLLVEDDMSRLCISGPSLTTLASGGPIEPSPTASDGIVVTATGTGSADGQHYSFMIGRTGSNVSAVALTLESGTHVRTTTARSWFAAWWPGTQYANHYQVTSNGRTVTHRLGAPGPPARRGTSDRGTTSGPGARRAGAP